MVLRFSYGTHPKDPNIQNHSPTKHILKAENKSFKAWSHFVIIIIYYMTTLYYN